MKYIIDISNELYETAKNKSECSYDEYDAMRAIANGIPYENTKKDWDSMMYLIQEANKVFEVLDKIRAEISELTYSYKDMDEWHLDRKSVV